MIRAPGLGLERQLEIVHRIRERRGELRRAGVWMLDPRAAGCRLIERDPPGASSYRRLCGVEHGLAGRCRAGLGQDGRVVLRRAWRRGEIGRRGEHDLIDRKAILTSLDPHRLRTRNAEMDQWSEPAVAGVGPAPAGYAAAAALFEDQWD